MANLFKPSEILKIALRIEENGREYYLEAKERASTPDMADLFGFLADEEVRHLEVFSKMLADVGEEKVPESYPGEHDAYIRALAAGHVFTRDSVGKDMVAEAKDEKEILKFALGFEKDSILLYYEMLDLVPASKRAVVEEVIREEKSHVRKLNEIRDSIR
jgi:rubrerythrin